MITRRELLAGTAVLGAAEGAAATPLQDTHLLSGILHELQELRQAASIGAEAVGRIRAVRKAHLKQTGRFPLYVDVGVDIFEGTIDWLTALEQPVTISQQGDGRYTVSLLGTTLVLRPDYPDNYVGQGYDR